MKFLCRFQGHFTGRVATLAAAIGFSAIVSLALLPITTRILHAKDYGTYAWLMSAVVLVSAAIDGGAGLLLPAHYGPASRSERGRIFASVAIVATAGTSAVGLLLVGLWTWRYGAIPNPPLPTLMIVLTAVLMPMRAVTCISIVAYSVTGRSLVIAAQMASQAIAVFICTLVALFGFAMEGTSLFIGAACGQFVAMCIGLIALARHGELSCPSLYWFRRASVNAPTTGACGFAEGTRGFAESAMLSSVGGLHAVGILTHARLYLKLLGGLSSAVGQNAWGRALEDARNLRSDFETTRSAWTPVQIAISAIAIIFVFLGRDIVDIISNGKLTEAADYIPGFLLIALIQTIEQPAAATVYALNQGGKATWFKTLVLLGNLVALYPMIVFFGINGILGVCILEALACRLYLRVLARRERDVPFHDEVFVAGGLAVIVAMVYVHSTSPSLGLQLGLMAGIFALLGIVGRRSIGELIVVTRQIVLRRPA